MHRASAKGYEDTKVVGPEELPFVRQMMAPGTRIFAWVDPAWAVPLCWYLGGFQKHRGLTNRQSDKPGPGADFIFTVSCVMHALVLARNIQYVNMYQQFMKENSLCKCYGFMISISRYKPSPVSDHKSISLGRYGYCTSRKVNTARHMRTMIGMK